MWRVLLIGPAAALFIVVVHAQNADQAKGKAKAADNEGAPTAEELARALERVTAEDGEDYDFDEDDLDFFAEGPDIDRVLREEDELESGLFGGLDLDLGGAADLAMDPERVLHQAEEPKRLPVAAKQPAQNRVVMAMAKRDMQQQQEDRRRQQQQEEQRRQQQQQQQRQQQAMTKMSESPAKSARVTGSEKVQETKQDFPEAKAVRAGPKGEDARSRDVPTSKAQGHEPTPEEQHREEQQQQQQRPRPEAAAVQADHRPPPAAVIADPAAVDLEREGIVHRRAQAMIEAREGPEVILNGVDLLDHIEAVKAEVKETNKSVRACEDNEIYIVDGDRTLLLTNNRVAKDINTIQVNRDL